MSKLTVITDRALERALEIAGNAGDSLRHAAPHASDWLKTGAALSAVKTGGKVAGKLVRRNPAVTIAAAVAGLGLIGYAVYRKRKQQDGSIDGSARRIETEQRSNANARRAARQSRRVAATPTDSAE